MKRSYKLIITLLLVGCGRSATAQTATISWGIVHQQIDGFGASSAFEANPLTPSQAVFFFSQSGGIGLSLLRTKIPDDGSCATVQQTCAGQVTDMQLAVANGARVWSTPWSPPASMKSNASLLNGGSLEAAFYQSYANYLSNYIQSLNNLFGIKLYAISVQNEPDLVTSYESAIWTSQNFHDFILNNLGPTLQNNGRASVRIVMPESQVWGLFNSDAGVTMNDPSAAAYVGINAWHDYDDASSVINPYASKGKGFWETEASSGSGYGPSLCGGCWDPSMADALLWAQIVDNRMVLSNANAWNYWWLVNYWTNDNEGLIGLDGTVSKRAYMLGNYSKFVRPGYVRIDATHIPQTGVTVSAYKNASTGTFAIIITNQNASEVTQTFGLNGFSVATVTPWVTSSSLDLVEQPNVAVSGGSFAYTIPARSVVTLVGTGLAPSSSIGSTTSTIGSSTSSTSSSASTPTGSALSTIRMFTDSNKCVDVSGVSMSNGAAVQLWDCNGQKNQSWSFVPVTTSTGQGYQLVSVNSGLCLDVDGVSTANGAHLQQWQCGGPLALNQIWQLLPYGNNYEIVSENSGLCLDLSGGNLTDGTLFQQWACGNGDNSNQLFNLSFTAQ